MKPGDLVCFSARTLTAMPIGSVVRDRSGGEWTSYLSAVVPGLVLWRRPARRRLSARVLSSRDLLDTSTLTVVSLPAPEPAGDGG